MNAPTTKLDHAPILPADGTYKVGTLTYTKLGLISVFFWMLWGDLCVNIMETIIPRIVPLQLEGLGASKTIIGFVSGSLLAGVNFAINPFISTYSDRFRSKWGRRRPFIIVCTPILTLCLIAVGYADDVTRFIHPLVGWTGMSQNAVGIAMLALLLIVFQIFNVIVLAVYYYMIADVVPQSVIGKFTAMYKIVGQLGGGVIFMYYIFPHARTAENAIYLGCGLVYFFAFMLMVWRVREGEYPEPPMKSTTGNASGGLGRWLSESFAIRFYQKVYLIGLLFWVGSAPSIFIQLFSLNDLNMTLAQFGKATAIASFVTLPIFFVMGILADKYHPIRMVLIGHGTIALIALLSFFFVHNPFTFMVFTIMNAIAATIYLGGQISLFPRTFPRPMYGQYCSANMMVSAAGQFGAPIVAGLLLDTLSSNRGAYLWQATFSTLGVFACLLVYRHWIRLGGDLHYTPPMLAVDPTKDRGFEAIETAPVTIETEATISAATTAVQVEDISETPPDSERPSDHRRS